MSVLTIGLLVFALILLTTNIIIDIIQGDFMGLGNLSSFKSGFTPMSNDFSGSSPFFQPEGYGELGTYSGTITATSLKRRIDSGGLSYTDLKRKYPSKHDYQFIT
jgi:hypothetical protein